MEGQGETESKGWTNRFSNLCYQRFPRRLRFRRTEGVDRWDRQERRTDGLVDSSVGVLHDKPPWNGRKVGKSPVFENVPNVPSAKTERDRPEYKLK